MNTTNCSNKSPTTDVYYKEISDEAVVLAALCACCVLAVLCVVIFIEELYFIQKHYSKSDTRAWKIRVLLGLYPVVSTLSIIAVLVPTSSTLMDLMTACYLSSCIYVFIIMTIECYGGADKMVETLADDMVRLTTPPCCCLLCCILKPIKMTRQSLRVFEILSMQVMFIRPALMFIAAVLWTDGRYDGTINAKEPYIYILVVSAISTMLSMYGLIVIFRASRVHLTHYHLVLKFISLQAMIILINLQSAIFHTLANYDLPACIGSRGSRVRGEHMNKSLLVAETFLFCLLARKGYRTHTPDIDEMIEHTSTRKTSGDSNSPRSSLGINVNPYYDVLYGSTSISNALAVA